ncbi:MAG: type III PLP-dependent enzyme [Kutzneria sp.]|nr:type III PLP-dependent enzyme [Kutzneria sp.]
MIRIRSFLDDTSPPTPCLVLDLRTVRERYLQLAWAFGPTESRTGARLCYAVKANPAPEVVRLLVGLGARFDAASVPEIELCLSCGASPDDISYGNTIKKRADIARAHALGVHLFTSDSIDDVSAIAECAPGSSVFCRILLADTGSLTPFGAKFGCSASMAEDLLATAARLGLRPAGVAFHVGSQQPDPGVWDTGIATAADITARLAARGIMLPMLNVGGGLPGQYTQAVPPFASYAAAITASVCRHFDRVRLAAPRVMLEPGRCLVADAGLLRAEVVLVSRKSTVDDRRWVYLDVGRYGGLAETEQEYITYRLETPGRGGPTGPVYLAGPTCDGDDVLYQHTVYELPMDLRQGDPVDFLSAGAYTASYSSVAFNGFPPLVTHCI